MRPKRKLERDRGRPKTESKSDTTRLLQEALAGSSDALDLEELELEHQDEYRIGEPIVRNRGVHLRGTHRDGRQLEVILFRSARSVLTLLIAGGPDEPYPAEFLELMKRCRFEPPEQTPYHEHLTWNGPLGYNLAYSFGSTLAFLLLTLFLGAWRLSRIDY